MSKTLRAMTEAEEQEFLERMRVFLKGYIPLDADYFIILSTTDRKKSIHMSNVGEDEAIEWLDDTADHIHKNMKVNARRKRRER